MTSEREKTWRELIDTLDSYAAACVRIGAASGRAAAGADEFAARDRVRLVALLRAALAASPESPEPRPLDEKHVQYATVSAPLMSAMCMGKWRIGPIIFEAPGGHGSFSAWAILAPWPWLRAGKDTPYAAIERFLAACPPEPPGCSHHGPGCPDPQPYPPSAPPPVMPGEEEALCACGHSTARFTVRPHQDAPHYLRPDGVWCAVCGDACPAPPPPVTDAGRCPRCQSEKVEAMDAGYRICRACGALMGGLSPGQGAT